MPVSCSPLQPPMLSSSAEATALEGSDVAPLDPEEEPLDDPEDDPDPLLPATLNVVLTTGQATPFTHDLKWIVWVPAAIEAIVSTS